MLAPRSSSRRTASGLPTAHISAVWPKCFSRALGSAPRRRRNSMSLTCPSLAAVISGVSPLSRVALGSAPRSKSSSATPAAPFSIASASGGMPSGLAKSGLAPASSRRRAIASLPRTEDHAKAVEPSSAIASGFAPSASRAETCAKSSPWAASTSGSCGADADPAGKQSRAVSATVGTRTLGIGLDFQSI